MKNGRAFPPSCFLGLLLTGLLAAFAGTAHANPQDQNLLFIWIDDLGTQRIDYPEAKLPNLDALAESGVTFTQAHAPGVVCSSSRGAVLSGIPIHISRHGGNAKKAKFRSIKAFKNVVTWPEHLMTEHNRTAYTTGKIFHAGPDTRSFDYFGPHRGGPEKRGRKVERSKVGIVTSYSTQAPEDTNDFMTAAYGAEVVSQSHDKPFVAMVGIRRPHPPWFVPAQFNQWELDEIGIPPGYLDDDRDDTYGKLGKLRAKFALDQRRGNWKPLIRGYLSAAAFADAAAGVVLDALAAGPNADNTLVIVAGDHGHCLGEKEHVTKQVMWECGSRTELIISGPGVASGTTVDSVVSLMDLQPTALDLMNLPARNDTFGRSLKPLILAGADPDVDNNWDGWAISSSGRKTHALRGRGYSYIRHRGGQEELYDTRVDPWEHTNLLYGGGVPDGYQMMSTALDNLLSGASQPFE